MPTLHGSLASLRAAELRRHGGHHDRQALAQAERRVLRLFVDANDGHQGWDLNDDFRRRDSRGEYGRLDRRDNRLAGWAPLQRRRASRLCVSPNRAQFFAVFYQRVGRGKSGRVPIRALEHAPRRSPTPVWRWVGALPLAQHPPDSLRRADHDERERGRREERYRLTRDELTFTAGAPRLALWVPDFGCLLCLRL